MASAGVPHSRRAPPRSRARRARREDLAHREPNPECGLHARGDADGEQRVPSRQEEVVVHPQRVRAEDLPPDREHPALGGVPRGRPRTGFALRRPGGRREGDAVELAVGGEGEVEEGNELGGDEVGGEEGVEVTAQVVARRGGVGGGGDDEGGEVGGRGARREHVDDDRAHAGVARDRSLDLPGLDAEPPQLHLAVATAEVLDLTVWPPTAQVAASIRPSVGGREERVREELAARQRGFPKYPRATG